MFNINPNQMAGNLAAFGALLMSNPEKAAMFLASKGLGPEEFMATIKPPLEPQPGPDVPGAVSPEFGVPPSVVAPSTAFPPGFQPFGRPFGRRDTTPPSPGQTPEPPTSTPPSPAATVAAASQYGVVPPFGPTSTMAGADYVPPVTYRPDTMADRGPAGFQGQGMDLGAMLNGVVAPESPQVPNVSSPSPPSPKQLDPNLVMQLLASMFPAFKQQGMGTLGQMLRGGG